MVYNLFDRSLILSDKIYHYNNIKIVKDILSANKYPIHFVNKFINKSWNLLKNCNYNITRNNIPIKNNYRNKIFIKIPFRFRLYQKIKEIINDKTFHVIPQLNKDMTKRKD